MKEKEQEWWRNWIAKDNQDICFYIEVEKATEIRKKKTTRQLTLPTQNFFKWISNFGIKRKTNIKFGDTQRVFKNVIFH